MREDKEFAIKTKGEEITVNTEGIKTTIKKVTRQKKKFTYKQPPLEPMKFEHIQFT